MRTLKKSLALVLALVMLLGLGVVGASADNALDNYTDADEIGDAYLEAVGVLTGLGIVDGMTETTIVPQATYTRAQAAKIITTMVLGVNGAKSCVASYAPFDDVAAEHWAAGYIAFCKEQGIIDGVTDTTFDPEGTLTGYQWAKMLLAAVGFNANNELEGSSWSLNTARIGREVGLFDGDLAGADHTPLRREQAMLYAFNTLSAVRQVTYTANGDNYVYNIWGYEWADGTGYTLGQAVFGLEGYTGIIVANEGTGADYTVLSKNYTNTATSRIASVVADTAADMMYHAARIWTVVDDHDTIGTSDDERVSVYVYDLAKVTESTCNDIAKAVSDNASKVGKNNFDIGDKTAKDAEPYEYALIDNTAYAAKSYADVTFYYSMGELGITDAKKDTTVVAGKTVDNDDIWTDISDIAKFSTVIYMNANGIYYVYPVSSTTGTIESLSSSKKTVTLTDGTVLSESIFYDMPTLSTNDGASLVVGNTYTFVLDTHGHIMSISREGIADLYFYTGEWKITSDLDSYHGEHTYSAQFYHVNTGEPVDLPVNSSFIFTHNAAGKVNGLREVGFYDLGVANANGIYTPGKVEKDGYSFKANEPVVETDNIYANSYAVVDDLVLTANTTIIEDVYNVSGNVYLDSDATFYIASGDGSKASVTEYDSLAELIAAYPGTTLELSTSALSVYKTNTGNYACDVVFGVLPSVTSSGVYLFLPDMLDGSEDWDSTTTANGGVDYVYEDDFYLNGTAISVTTDTPLNDLGAGFYSFDVKDNRWELKAIDGSKYPYGYSGMTVITSSANRVWLDNKLVVDNPAVVDCRPGYAGEDYEVNSIDKLLAEFGNSTVKLAYTWNSSNQVEVIYVLEQGWAETTNISLSDTLVEAGWYFAKAGNDTLTGYKTELSYKEETVPTTFVLANKYVSVPTTLEYNVTVDDNGTKATIQATAGNGVLTLTYSASKPASPSYVTNVEFGGLTNGSDITFTVSDGWTEWGISGGTKTIAAGKYVYGTPIELTLNCTQDTKGSDYKFSFENTGADIVVTGVETKDVGTSSQQITFDVYAWAAGTFTLTAADPDMNA